MFVASTIRGVAILWRESLLIRKKKQAPIRHAEAVRRLLRSPPETARPLPKLTCQACRQGNTPKSLAQKAFVAVKVGEWPKRNPLACRRSYDRVPCKIDNGSPPEGLFSNAALGWSKRTSSWISRVNEPNFSGTPRQMVSRMIVRADLAAVSEIRVVPCFR